MKAKGFVTSAGKVWGFTLTTIFNAFIVDQSRLKRGGEIKTSETERLYRRIQER